MCPFSWLHFIFLLAKCAKAKLLSACSLSLKVKTCFNLIALLHPAFLSASPLSLLFCLLLQDGGTAARFSCDVKSASLLLKSFPFLPSLSLHLSSTLPSLLRSPLPFLSRCHFPSTSPFHLLPSNLTFLLNVFIFSSVTLISSSGVLLPFSFLWSPHSPSLLFVNPPFTFYLSPSLPFAFSPSFQKPQSRPLPTRNTLTGSTQTHIQTHTHHKNQAVTWLLPANTFLMKTKPTA